MPELTEKVSMNLSVVDLGKIDILVDRGFYANRTDFLKDAIRRNLDSHQDVITETIDQMRRQDGAVPEEEPGKAKLVNITLVGVTVFTRRGLEAKRDKGEKIRLFCVGLAAFASDVPVELVTETFASAKIYGSLKGPEPIKAVVRGLPGVVVELS